MNMNTEELTNKIKEVIKELVECEIEEYTYPRERIYSIDIWNSIDECFEFAGDEESLQMKEYFNSDEENVYEFIDYYFEEVEKEYGVKYERNPWKNNDYYLVSNFKQNGFADVDELENHIKEDIEDFVSDTRDDVFDDVYDTDDKPVYTINASSKLYNIDHHLKTIGRYSEEDINYFENNAEKFLDYYFECVEEHTGLKYERDFWKNNVYNLVED